MCHRQGQESRAGKSPGRSHKDGKWLAQVLKLGHLRFWSQNPSPAPSSQKPAAFCQQSYFQLCYDFTTHSKAHHKGKCTGKLWSAVTVTNRTARENLQNQNNQVPLTRFSWVVAKVVGCPGPRRSSLGTSSPPPAQTGISSALICAAACVTGKTYA